MWCAYFRIVDQQTPQERMVQVVRWYLSAFHAGRRSSTAKKPYNPILGETFMCVYELPDEEPTEVSSLNVSQLWLKLKA